MKIIDAAEAMVNLERMVAAVKGQEGQESKFAKALATLKTLSRKEGIPLAIVGGLAAIHHGYKRFTKDIPGPEQLGVREGAGYAGIAGWMETKLGSYRVQDQADVVQVIKVTAPATLRRIRKHLGKAHAIYLRRFDELLGTAKEEKEQERERGRPREG